MKLIGQYDSPFVRRVGITLNHYGAEFEHLRYSVFRDAELIAEYNPLRKAPTLVLDGGLALTESSLILELLDEWAAAGRWQRAQRLLLPRKGPQRLQGLWFCGLAQGAMEKAVSLVYEEQIRDRVFGPWKRRCETQIQSTLRVLEGAVTGGVTGFVLGDEFTHPDIAASCLLTFIDGAVPQAAQGLELPKLRAIQTNLEQRSTFKEIWQPFDIPPEKA